MTCKSTIVVVFAAAGILYAAPKISSTAKSFHALKTTEEFKSALNLLGTPDSLIRKYSTLEFAGTLELMEKPGVKLPLFTHYAEGPRFCRGLLLRDVANGIFGLKS